MNELKPCPFCGGEARLINEEWFGIYQVKCKSNNCNGMTIGFNTLEEAITNWNNRYEELNELLTIANYNAKELILFAHELREKNITEHDIHDAYAMFKAGFKECNKAHKKSIERLAKRDIINEFCFEDKKEKQDIIG